jgi:hypothetical protein
VANGVVRHTKANDHQLVWHEAAVVGRGSVAGGTAAGNRTLSVPQAATAGVAFPVTLTVTDAFGNMLTDYTATVRFTSSEPRTVLPAAYTFNAPTGAGTPS